MIGTRFGTSLYPNILAQFVVRNGQILLGFNQPIEFLSDFGSFEELEDAIENELLESFKNEDGR